MTAKRSNRDVYIAIMVAAYKGVGLRLSAQEVGDLSIDEAIHQAALNGLDEKDWPEYKTHGEPKWENLNPNRRRRVAENLATKAPDEDVLVPRK